MKSEIEIQSKSKFSEKAKAKYNWNKNVFSKHNWNTIEIKTFREGESEIQSKLKFSIKAKAKYTRNRNSEGYPTLVKSLPNNLKCLKRILFWILSVNIRLFNKVWKCGLLPEKLICRNRLSHLCHSNWLKAKLEKYSIHWKV